jgi:hypothetical protein
MGLESEIERLFREAQDWDMELVASSALPTYHFGSTAPPGGTNTSVSWVKAGASGSDSLVKDRLQIAADKDFFLLDRLVFYKVDEDAAKAIGKERRDWLKKHHGAGKYKKNLDGVAEAYETWEAEHTAARKTHALEHALEHLKEEGPNYPIAIKLYHSSLPKKGVSFPADKVVITFENCDYILRGAHSSALGQARVSPGGLVARWPREIELRTEPGKEGNVYIRADLWKQAKTAKKSAATKPGGRLAKPEPGPHLHESAKS